MATAATVGAVAENNTSFLKKMPKLAKVGGMAGIITLGTCIFDFMDVPSAFKLKYDDNGQKVEGTNWKNGGKETGKSLIRCLSYFVLPALLLNPLSAGGAIAATVASVGKFVLPIGISKMWQKILPSEQKLVADACKQKGIAYNPKATDNPDGHDVDKIMDIIDTSKITTKKVEYSA